MPRPFNIFEVKQNDVLPTKSGVYTVEIICTNAYGVFPIAGLVTGLEYKNKLFSFRSDGTRMYNNDDDSMDLVLPDNIGQKYIAIFKSKGNGMMHVRNELYESIEDADVHVQITILTDGNLLKYNQLQVSNMSRPFNIDEVKQNDIVPTRSGKYTVKILCTDADGQYPIIGLVNGEEYKNSDQRFTINGKWQWNDQDDMDLVLPDYKESIDVYVYRSHVTRRLFVDSTLLDNETLLKQVTIQI